MSSEWLIQFAKQHWSETDRSDKGYEDTTITRAYELIAHCRYCFNPKGDSVPLEWIAVYDGDYDDELTNIQIDTIYVLAVCSDEEDDFGERPTQEKTDVMTKLTGKEPQ
ncbi:hypothetical protein DFH29DRAFT_869914 [Suillus ampliporus]|nr:hypothetical protein DFH29DRAFT_869914 [Suillus ampliporus]